MLLSPFFAPEAKKLHSLYAAAFLFPLLHTDSVLLLCDRTKLIIAFNFAVLGWDTAHNSKRTLKTRKV